MNNTKLRIFVVMGLLAVSLLVTAGRAFAKGGDTGTKPGWGWGDTNHEHTGPPGGPSVHPSE